MMWETIINIFAVIGVVSTFLALLVIAGFVLGVVVSAVHKDE